MREGEERQQMDMEEGEGMEEEKKHNNRNKGNRVVFDENAYALWLDALEGIENLL